MTMFPVDQNLSNKQHFYGGGTGVYGGGGSEGFCLTNHRLQGYDCCSSDHYNQAACLLGSDLVLVRPPIMAEDESRTESVNEEAGSTSKDVVQDQEKDNEGWLQLSIGGQSRNQNNKQDEVVNHQHHHHQRSQQRGELIELNLLPGNNISSSDSEPPARLLSTPSFHTSSGYQIPRPLTNVTSTTYYGYGNTSSLFQQQHQGASSSSFPHHQDQINNWIYRPMSSPRPIAIPCPSPSPSPSSSSFMAPPGTYFARSPFQLQAGMNVPGPSIDFRVIDPPRRPHSGIWFMLQASQNQAKEPFLPQIPKSYLRIKDGRMTIRLVMKYLANKLRLESESEVEITCRGQQLLPFLTLQHVRDNLWNSRNTMTMRTIIIPDSSSSPTTDHIMLLHYGRSP